MLSTHNLDMECNLLWQASLIRKCCGHQVRGVSCCNIPPLLPHLHSILHGEKTVICLPLRSSISSTKWTLWTGENKWNTSANFAFQPKMFLLKKSFRNNKSQLNTRRRGAKICERKEGPQHFIQKPAAFVSWMFCYIRNKRNCYLATVWTCHTFGQAMNISCQQFQIEPSPWSKFSCLIDFWTRVAWGDVIDMCVQSFQHSANIPDLTFLMERSSDKGFQILRSFTQRHLEPQRGNCFAWNKRHQLICILPNVEAKQNPLRKNESIKTTNQKILFFLQHRCLFCFVLFCFFGGGGFLCFVLFFLPIGHLSDNDNLRPVTSCIPEMYPITLLPLKTAWNRYCSQ